MTGKQIGATIESGPTDWSIVQQENGSAAIALAGGWTPPDGIVCSGARVFARILREEDAVVVTPWQPGEMLPGGKWRIGLAGVPAGGLYRIETCLQINDNPVLDWAVRGDMIHHVGVGDLWVIAGQSNAAGYGRGPYNDPPEIGVHLLRNSGQWDLAAHPFNDSTRTIHMDNREGGNPGHSPFLAFGKMILRETGMPVGLIQTALGGSPLKAWNPDEDGYLFRNMLNVIDAAGGKVRGILWYQGCSDCAPEESATYLGRFANFVGKLRRELGDKKLPVLTVQLNRLTDDEEGAEADGRDRSWGMVREAQRQAANTIPGVWVVPASDCPLSDPIHNSPAGNMLIGERMAKTALAFVYKKGEPFAAPDLSNAALLREGASPAVRLQFKQVQGQLIATGEKKRVFAVADSTGPIDVVDWQVASPHEIVLTLGREPLGEAVVHGAYETNPASRLPLDSGTYMPMLSFYGCRISQR